MPIDDPLEQEIAELAAELTPALPNTVARSVAMAFAGISLPGIGPAMLALFRVDGEEGVAIVWPVWLPAAVGVA